MRGDGTAIAGPASDARGHGPVHRRRQRLGGRSPPSRRRAARRGAAPSSLRARWPAPDAWRALDWRRRAGVDGAPVARRSASWRRDRSPPAAWRTWTARSRWPGGRADGALYLARDAVGERTLFYARCRRAAWCSPRRCAALLATGLRARTLDLPGRRRLPRLRLRARPRDAGGRASTSCCPARSSTSRGGRVSARALLDAAGGARGAAARRGRAARALRARLEDAVRPAPAARRAGRRVPLRRPRLEPGRRAGRAAARRAGAHLLGLVRPRATRTSCRSARWSPSTAAPTTASSSCRPRSCSATSTTRSACSASRSATR